jgi:hypothetical protein
MKVSIVISKPAPISGADPATAGSMRDLFHTTELAQALSGALSIEVRVVDGGLEAAPPDGYLLVFQVPATIDPESAHRIVALDEDRSSLMKRVESHGFVAAVEKQRYFEWCSRREAERGYGIVGKKDIAARMSGRIASGPYTSARYGMIASSTARDLPGLIAEYLQAYESTAGAR